MKGENFFYTPFKSPADNGQQVAQSVNPTGAGAMAHDQPAWSIDLNEQLVKNKPATFFLRVNSNAMEGAGVQAGDVIIVDRSLEPKSGKMVIAVVDGEMLIRRLEINGGKKRLVPATKKLAPIDVTEAGFMVWGVVTYVIHHV